MITDVQRKVSKNNGRPYAIVTVEDLEASVEIMFFGDAYEPVAGILATDLVIAVTGRVRTSDDRPLSIMAQSMTIPDVTDPADRPLAITMPVERCTEPVIERLGAILDSHRGPTDVHLTLTRPGKKSIMRLDRRYRVVLGPSLFGDLKALLGPSCLQ
jgi:DNA polymerase-3 subunit alpha